jgi:hypothetical protein
MSRPPFRWSRLVLLTCATWIITLVLAPAAHAQDDDAFKTGINARGDRKWQDVVLQMRRAIQDDATESTRMVRSGIGSLLRQGGTQYLPHFFLGEALFNLQDCVGAVGAWSRSEQQRAVRSRPDLLAILQNGYVSCEAKGVLPPVKYDPLLTRITQNVNDVNTQARTVTTLGTANIDLWQGDVKEQYERASGEIQNARTRLEAATKSRSQSDFNDAGAATERAKRILVTIETNLRATISARLSIQGQARDVEQMIAAADESDRAIDARKTALTPSLNALRQEGQNAVTRARDRLSAGVKASNASVLSESRTLAQEASTRLKQVLDELTRFEKDALQRQLTDAAARANEAFAFVDGAFATLDHLATERPALMRPDMSAEREAVQRQVSSVRRRFDAARKAEDVSSIVDVTRRTLENGNRLNALISAFGPMTITDRGVPTALAEGARLFFAGEYQQAVSALNPSDGFAPELPLQLHVHLFRAAASYALFLQSREADQALLKQALDEVKQCKQINPAFEPDPRAFTPKFIAFFHNGSAAGTKSAAAPASQQ